MSTFFHGWQRKTGCVALVVACVLTIGWVRSYLVEDRFAFTIGDFRHAIGSSPGSFVWDHWIDKPRAGGFGWSCDWHNLNNSTVQRPAYYRAPAGSALGQLQFESRAMPYWPFALPPTLLSVILLLTGPRTARMVTHAV